MIRFSTAGESHGEALVALVSGIPAGVPVDLDFINRELWRRQQGYGRGGRTGGCLSDDRGLEPSYQFKPVAMGPRFRGDDTGCRADLHTLCMVTETFGPFLMV